MTDPIDEVFAAPMRRKVVAIGDSIYLHRLAADIDFNQAEASLGQLFNIAVAAQQVMIALDNPPAAYRSSRWRSLRSRQMNKRGVNYNLTVTTDKLRAALGAFNNS